MRFRPVSFRPTFGRILSVVTALIAALGLAGLIVAGDSSELLRHGWSLLLLGAVAFALFWFPRLDVDETKILVRNVFTTSHIPWTAIERIDTKYALTLYTRTGRIAVWASPAPSRYATMSAARSDAKIAATDGTSAIRPGDLLSTQSGAAAFVIRRHWEELRDDGLLDAGEAETVTRDVHWRTIAVLAVLLVATVLGFAL